MMNCAYCELKDIKEAVIYEGVESFVAVSPFPSVQNEVIIVPKQHFTIFEQIPESTLSEMAILSKYFGAVLFDHLKCQGTNILIQNGTAAGQTIAHTSIRILPRNNISELDTSWDSKEMSPSDLEKYAEKIKNSLTKISGLRNNESIVSIENKHNHIEEIPLQSLTESASDDKNHIKDIAKRAWEDEDLQKRQLFRTP